MKAEWWIRISSTEEKTGDGAGGCRFSEYISIKDAEVEEIYGWNDRGREVRWCVRRGGRGQGRMEADDWLWNLLTGSSPKE